MTAKKQNPDSDNVAPDGDVKLKAVASVSLLRQHRGVLDDELYELLAADERYLKSR